jgi:hypothetical protein
MHCLSVLFVHEYQPQCSTLLFQEYQPEWLLPQESEVAKVGT